MNYLKLIRLLLVLLLLVICLSSESKLFKKKQANSFVLIEKLQNAKILIDDVFEGENKFSSTITNRLDMAITRLYYAQLAILFDDNVEETDYMIDFLQGIQSLIAESQIESNSNVTDLENANKYIQEVEGVFLL